mmetsp:Transcript_46582/g.82070  ORF Transcript_46582/g.82070 Transcript_46582/m.82070 type:complete len:239 (+) Transcript_46582:264-980(+)
MDHLQRHQSHHHSRHHIHHHRQTDLLAQPDLIACQTIQTRHRNCCLIRTFLLDSAERQKESWNWQMLQTSRCPGFVGHRMRHLKCQSIQKGCHLESVQPRIHRLVCQLLQKVRCLGLEEHQRRHSMWQLIQTCRLPDSGGLRIHCLMRHLWTQISRPGPEGLQKRRQSCRCWLRRVPPDPAVLRRLHQRQPRRQRGCWTNCRSLRRVLPGSAAVHLLQGCRRGRLTKLLPASRTRGSE